MGSLHNSENNDKGNFRSQVQGHFLQKMTHFKKKVTETQNS